MSRAVGWASNHLRRTAALRSSRQPRGSLYFAIMKRTILFLLALTVVATVASADEVIRCESRGSRRRCPHDRRAPVSTTVPGQYSAASCVQGSSYGWRDGELWVDNGCRAEFLI